MPVEISYYPTFKEVRQLRDAEAAKEGDGRKPLLPLCRVILADMETPVSAYCKVARGAYTFLLESVEGGERIARYSFIGVDPYLVMTQRGGNAILRKMQRGYTAPASTTQSVEEIPCHDPLEFIEAELGQYRLVAPVGIVPDGLPRFHGGAVGYVAYETVARFERLPVPEKDPLGLPLAVFCFTETVVVFDHLKHRVRVVTHLHLDAPDLDAEYQRACAVLDDVQQRLQQGSPLLPCEPAPLEDTAALQVVSNRTPAGFETMVLRGLEYIWVGEILQVVLSERLGSEVIGAVVTVYEALRAGFPAGTVSGAPKIRAMEIISELEDEQRGVYAGAVGYFSYSGNLDTAIALRTMVMQNGRAYIQAGGRIVADSDPVAEYQESMNKARALLRALDEAEKMAEERRGTNAAITR